MIDTHIFQLFELLFGWMVENAAIHGKVFRPFSFCTSSGSHAFDHASKMFLRNTGRIPSTSLIDHSFESLADISAKDDRWVWFLKGLWPNVGLRDSKELSVELCWFLRPNRLQQLNEFVRTPPAGCEVHSCGFDFVFRPADAETANQSAARKLI